MADKEFTVTELRAEGNSFVDTPVVFKWTAKNQSAPRPSWKFGGHLRTVREDYPGNDKPTEQVLGPNFTPFTVEGVWDNRYNPLADGSASDFAWETFRNFEALCFRGNPVRISFEELTVQGLITDWTFDYRRRNFITYQFTVSPHYRSPDTRPLVPLASLDPQKLVDLNAAAVQALLDAQLQAPDSLDAAVRSDLDTLIAKIFAAVKSLQELIDSGFAIFDSAFAVLNRIRAAFVAVKNLVGGVLSKIAAISSAATLTFENFKSTLDFESWRRTLRFQALATFGAADQAQKEIGRRVDPKARALYRPQAGENLYQISNRFYNTPHQWKRIADRNKLHYFNLHGTELLVIPEAN